VTNTASRLLRVTTLLAITLGAWGAVATPAHAAEGVDTYVAEAALAADGTLQVTATITFDEPPATLTQTIDTTSRTADSREYRFTISDVTATSGGTDLQPAVTASEGGTVISIPTAAATAPVELAYTVRGASIATADGGTSLVWPLVQGLNVATASFDGTVSVPGPWTSLDCEAGDPAAPGACTFFGGGTADNRLPLFHHEALAAGGFVEATIRFPAGAVAVNEDVRNIWTAQRAFSVGPAELLAALGLALLGGLGLWFAHRKVGRDATGAVAPTRVAEFHPIAEGQSEFRVLDDVRPGQVGTVLDERVDPVDVTATLLDLAVRGHLRIEELDRPSPHAASDWAFVRLESTAPLAPYEKTLLDAVAPLAGGPVTVSSLSAAVAPAVPTVQSQLYDEVVARGWFARRPDTTRNLWTRLGWVALALALVISFLLTAFTTFGLVGVVLVLLALGVLFVAAEMPARTTAGAGVLSGLQVLSGTLHTQPTDQLPKGREYEQLSRILPYAVVLGGADRWLQAIALADADADSDGADLTWYQAGSDWHLSDLPDSVRNFVTTVQGTLFSR